jgi:hypothetical protein
LASVSIIREFSRWLKTNRDGANDFASNTEVMVSRIFQIKSKPFEVLASMRTR